MKRVSILLAVHNGERFLDEAIRSVVDQRHDAWELLIVSNGSTDATATIAAAWTARDARIRWYDLPRKNKNAAYNLAFTHATGDYICYFAADDHLPPESLAERLEALPAGDARAFSTCCLRTFSDDPKYDGVLFPRNRRRPNYSGGSLLFPRALAERIFPLPEEQPNEDTWTSLHLRAFGTLYHVPRALYRYRIHAGNSYGYGLDFEDKRQGYLRRMAAYELFHEKFRNEDVPFVRDEVVPFVKGLHAARDRSMLRVLAVRRLRLASKMVLAFYCSRALYVVRHSYFRILSGGVAR